MFIEHILSTRGTPKLGVTGVRRSRKRYRWICVGRQQADNEEESECWETDKNITMRWHRRVGIDIIPEYRASRTRPGVMVNLVKLIVVLGPDMC